MDVAAAIERLKDLARVKGDGQHAYLAAGLLARLGPCECAGLTVQSNETNDEPELFLPRLPLRYVSRKDLIIEFLRRAGAPRSLAQIARALDIHKATAHQILQNGPFARDGIDSHLWSLTQGGCNAGTFPQT